MVRKGRRLIAAVQRRYDKAEIARRGDAIDQAEVAPRLKPDDDGKFAAIDIETGAYDIDADEMQAGGRLRARLPVAQIWMVRIGRRAVHRIGGWDRQSNS